jgi:hypothetical protein
MEYIHFLVWFVCGFFCGATLMRDKINRETKRRYQEMLDEMHESKKRGYGRVREIKEDDK